MYFLYRDGKYIDMAARAFGDFCRKIADVAIHAHAQDWADH